MDGGRLGDGGTDGGRLGGGGVGGGGDGGGRKGIPMNDEVTVIGF